MSLYEDGKSFMSFSSGTGNNILLWYGKWQENPLHQSFIHLFSYAKNKGMILSAARRYH
jgi:hypothetical protein